MPSSSSWSNTLFVGWYYAAWVSVFHVGVAGLFVTMKHTSVFPLVLSQLVRHFGCTWRIIFAL